MTAHGLPNQSTDYAGVTMNIPGRQPQIDAEGSNRIGLNVEFYMGIRRRERYIEISDRVKLMSHRTTKDVTALLDFVKENFERWRNGN